MKTKLIIFLMPAALMAPAILFGGTCATTSVNVTISYNYTFGGISFASAVYPDSALAYSDGVNGVRAIINNCSGDLILDLNNSTRQVGFSFQNSVAANGSTPSWTSTPFFASGAYLVVNNLMFNYNASVSHSFTTGAELAFTPPGGTSKSPDTVCFHNLTADVTGGCLNVNYPDNTSLLMVVHTPANSAPGGVETWTIYPDNTNMNLSGTPAATQVGTLQLPPHGGSRDVNAGQFSMPFQFTVTPK
ncbi:MAG TPA: hypothetical protein VKB79_01065 [Bryobacteraceae bacterium]|nr:hypothetical protein [Bryobacteraceae bacterium]